MWPWKKKDRKDKNKASTIRLITHFAVLETGDDAKEMLIEGYNLFNSFLKIFLKIDHEFSMEELFVRFKKKKIAIWQKKQIEEIMIEYNKKKFSQTVIEIDEIRELLSKTQKAILSLVE